MALNAEAFGRQERTAQELKREGGDYGHEYEELRVRVRRKTHSHFAAMHSWRCNGHVNDERHMYTADRRDVTAMADAKRSAGDQRRFAVRRRVVGCECSI